MTAYRKDSLHIWHRVHFCTGYPDLHCQPWLCIRIYWHENPSHDPAGWLRHNLHCAVLGLFTHYEVNVMVSSAFCSSDLVWKLLMTLTHSRMFIPRFGPLWGIQHIYKCCQTNIAFLNMVLFSIGSSPASIQARTFKIKRPFMFWICSSSFRVFFEIQIALQQYKIAGITEDSQIEGAITALSRPVLVRFMIVLAYLYARFATSNPKLHTKVFGHQHLFYCVIVNWPRHILLWYQNKIICKKIMLW